MQEGVIALIEKIPHDLQSPENKNNLYEFDPLATALPGRYVFTYRCIAGNGDFTPALAIEMFTVSQGASELLARQENNSIVQQSAEGVCQCIGGRVLINISYEYGQYTDSVYYFLPVSTEGRGVILYGIYTDVTSAPTKEIFSTKILAFPWHQEKAPPDRYRQTEDVFRLLAPFLTNEISDRKRLVIEPPGFNTRSQICEAVSLARLALEQAAI